MQGGKLIWEANSIPPPQVVESVFSMFGSAARQVELIWGNEWKPLQQRVETFGELIKKRSKKQYCILFNVNPMGLRLNKILTMGFSNSFVGEKNWS